MEGAAPSAPISSCVVATRRIRPLDRDECILPRRHGALSVPRDDRRFNNPPYRRLLRAWNAPARRSGPNERPPLSSLGRASLTVSLRPSSSAPLIFSMASLLSCSVSKVTKAKPRARLRLRHLRHRAGEQAGHREDERGRA